MSGVGTILAVVGVIILLGVIVVVILAALGIFGEEQLSEKIQKL